MFIINSKFKHVWHGIMVNGRKFTLNVGDNHVEQIPAKAKRKIELLAQGIHRVGSREERVLTITQVGDGARAPAPAPAAAPKRQGGGRRQPVAPPAPPTPPSSTATAGGTNLSRVKPSPTAEMRGATTTPAQDDELAKLESEIASEGDDDHDDEDETNTPEA